MKQQTCHPEIHILILMSPYQKPPFLHTLVAWYLFHWGVTKNSFWFKKLTWTTTLSFLGKSLYVQVWSIWCGIFSWMNCFHRMTRSFIVKLKHTTFLIWFNVSLIIISTTWQCCFCGVLARIPCFPTQEIDQRIIFWWSSA